MIQKNKLIILIGTGGVGKTSLAMSIAIAASQQGKKVAALTVDPSKRLSSVLNFTNTTENLEPMTSPQFRENLDIFHIDTEASFMKFAAEHVSEKQILKLKENKIFRQITKNLRETHNFVSLYEMVKIFDSNKYDLIILDTPPSNQVIDFFESPEKLIHFFSHQVREDKGEWYQWVKNKSLKLVESILSRLVGSAFVTEMELFFDGVTQIREQVQVVSRRFVSIVKGESTKIILIYSHAKDKIFEAKFLQKEMEKNNLTVDTFVMNRAYIPVLDQSKGTSIQKDSREEELYNYFCQRKEESFEVMRGMKKQSNSIAQNYILIPEINVNIRTEEDVLKFSKKMTENWVVVK